MTLSHPARLAAVLAAATVLAACGSAKRVSYEPEEFDSNDTHTRDYAATEAQTCEAARRALLSQGYFVSAANGELVTGKKHFQPAAEVHVEVELRVVCARQQGGRGTVAFATAVQDRYALKKASSSASVGVGAFGSLSLPFSSSDDALVKVSSATVTDTLFYDRLFALLARYLEPSPPAGPTPALPAPPLPPAPSGGSLTEPVSPGPSRG